MGSCTTQAPLQLPGFAYPRTRAAKSATGVASLSTAIVAKMESDVDAVLDEPFFVTGNGKFYNQVMKTIVR